VKLKDVRTARFIGDKENRGLIISFQAAVLRVFQNRGMLTTKQYERGVSILKDKSK
jgi:hypothetical protein